MKKVPKMINRCKFINIGLNTCGITNEGCLYMADPFSCPTYDESMHRAYVDGYKEKSPTEIAQLESHRVSEEVESLTGFADRLEAELNGMGIKVERTEEIIKEAPEWF